MLGPAAKEELANGLQPELAGDRVNRTQFAPSILRS